LFEFESYAKLTHFPDLNENRVPVERLQAKKSPDAVVGTLYQQNNKTTKEALLQARKAWR